MIWICDAHGIATNGDCRLCDDELIALSAELETPAYDEMPEDQ